MLLRRLRLPLLLVLLLLHTAVHVRAVGADYVEPWSNDCMMTAAVCVTSAACVLL